MRFSPALGEFYATTLYPTISTVLSFIASPIPFSLEEWIVVFSILFLLSYPFIAKYKKKTTKYIIAIECEVIGWIFVWFYLGWGCNYFRENFFKRTNTEISSVSKDEFAEFLKEYTDSLNSTYTQRDTIDNYNIIKDIKALYHSVPKEAGILTPKDYQKPKEVAFNKLYSSVGVLGYMGPFAVESQLNQQLFPIQYPFTYAHELAHLLSVSSEAEANYWAYWICTHSKDKYTRFSGYFEIISYVARDASNILSEKEFEEWKATILPDILDMKRTIQQFWQEQESPFLSEAQTLLYNSFLKSNNIPNGIQNYNQVIQMIISTRKNGLLFE